ncbi:MAG: kinase-like domain-containing protein [Podila humilis]|nr:MAG: kinase-like domain-containing protein [Podila humilis]
MANDRTQSAQVKKNSRAEEWLKNAVKDKHVRMIPFSEISKVKYNVAKGGSGTIHLGAWRNMHIAIKEQHNTNDLIKELKMHKQVHDSNYIVKFFGITKHPLTHDTCIVMQFAENGCLQDYLETQNVSITWLTKYRLAWEIASGLDFIHRENIFHTDLHSRNILIDTGGKALITDFGLSKSVNKTIYTTKAGLFGVVPYVAPERMQNPTYTYNAKCDIYSLGVIFWELSSCVIPFEVQLQDVMLAVNIIAGVREKTVPGTAVEYEMLFRRCWDGLPQNRPNMDIVLSELVELLAAEQTNPRPAAARPISPRPPRPLSGESMIAPSTPFPYDNNDNLPSPESTNHMRPASPPSRPNVRQSFAQLGPLAQNIPSVPVRQPDSTGAGARVSFVGEQLPKDIKPDQGKNVRQNAHLVPDSPTFNNNIHINSPPTKPTGMAPTDKKASPLASPTPEPGNNAPNSSPAPEDKKASSTPQLLPPLPTFGALALTTPPKDISPVPPINQNLSVLPETASLALASGLSMVNVVNKLNLTNIKNISTISPPPPGAPPPPPGTAGTAGTPRVISPPSNRPKVISPSKSRNNATPPRASKTISPPAPGKVLPPPGAPPKVAPSPSLGPTPKVAPSPSLGPTPKVAPSPSLGPTPKPPAGPPPSPHLNGSPPSGSNKASHMTYVPVTTYTPAPKSRGQEKKEGKDEESSETRPTPVRQLPLGFPVVPTLDPHVFGKRTPAEPTHLPSPASSPSSATASAPPSSGSTPSSVRNSTLLDIQGLKGDIFRANNLDVSRRDDAKNSRPIEMVKPPSPQYDNNQNRILNNSPSLTPSPSSRGAQGFFPVVDGRTGAKDPKLTALGNRSQDSLYKVEESSKSSRL